MKQYTEQPIVHNKEKDLQTAKDSSENFKQNAKEKFGVDGEYLQAKMNHFAQKLKEKAKEDGGLHLSEAIEMVEDSFSPRETSITMANLLCGLITNGLI